MRRGLRGVVGLALPALVVIAAFAADGAIADTCTATTAAELKTRLADANCTTVNLAAGTYDGTTTAFIPNHSVSIVGAGASSTTLTRTPSGPIFVAGTAGTSTSLSGVTVSGAVNGPGISMSLTASLAITNSVIANNTSTSSGAGIFSSAESPATLTVTDSVIRDNTENSFQGGGVSNSGTAPATFERVLFKQNHSTADAGGGGGFSNSVTGAHASFTNVTFFGNDANGKGGAIRVASSSVVDLNNVTIAFNASDANNNFAGEAGGGLFLESGTVTMRNSILAGSSDIGSAVTDDCARPASPSGELTRLGYELITTPGATCSFNGASDTATGYLNGNPGFDGVSLADNGGFSETLALLAGGQANNGGNPATPGSGGNACAAQDQRGLFRGGTAGTCDLGAFELGATPTPPVTPTVPGTSPPPTLPAKKKKKCKKKKHRAAAAKKCKKKRR